MPCLQPVCAGLPELQLLVECAEVHAATAERNTDLGWYALSAVLRACPYSILVEFNSHYGRTLLTLAEGSLEAGLAAEAAAGRTAGGASSSRDPPAGAGGGVLHLEVAAELANSLRICLRSEVQARQHAQGDASSFEAQGGCLQCNVGPPYVVVSCLSGLLPRTTCQGGCEHPTSSTADTRVHVTEAQMLTSWPCTDCVLPDMLVHSQVTLLMPPGRCWTPPLRHA
jgi:hypothetical protein